MTAQKFCNFRSIESEKQRHRANLGKPQEASTKSMLLCPKISRLIQRLVHKLYLSSSIL